MGLGARDCWRLEDGVQRMDRRKDFRLSLWGNGLSVSWPDIPPSSFGGARWASELRRGPGRDAIVWGSFEAPLAGGWQVEDDSPESGGLSGGHWTQLPETASFCSKVK